MLLYLRGSCSVHMDIWSKFTLCSLSSLRCDTKTAWPGRSGKSETLCGPLTHITTYIIQSQANLCLVTWITLWSQNVSGHARWNVSHICWIYYGKEHVEDVGKGWAVDRDCINQSIDVSHSKRTSHFFRCQLSPGSSSSRLAVSAGANKMPVTALW